jgi:hypothetical protein
MWQRIELAAIVTAAIAPLVACGTSDDAIPHSNGRGPAPFDPGMTYTPRVSPDELATGIVHPLFPAPIGARWVYEASTDEGLERDEVSVELGTQSVWGANARIVRDTVYLNGALKEDTRDWYAQDTAGNIWYLGEDTHEYENGEVKCACGAWESGVGGALPGVIMLGQPAIGDVYRQEYLAGEAEDVAEVIRLDVTVDVRAGTFTNCVQTRDRSAIDPELDEMKFYCPGIGNVLVLEGDTRVELVEYAGL